jgi:hypothetical protein
MAVPEVKRVHGRWGEIRLNSIVVAEAVGIEFTVEIDQVDVPITGGAWISFVEGQVRGSGTLRTVKAYSSFESMFLDYVSKSATELRAMRDAGQNPRPHHTISVTLDDPLSYGVEQVQLDGVKFWSMQGGYSLTDLVNRDWAFTFRGITKLAMIAGSPNYPVAPTQ